MPPPSPPGAATNAPRAPAAAAGYPLFVPLLLGLLAALGALLMQCVLLLLEHGTLTDAHAAQQVTVDNAAKLRNSLDTLAADTQRLADAGNPNAGLLVAELRKRGITINPNPPASAQPDATGASAPR